MKKLVKGLQKFWDGLPKELTVSVYLVVALFLSDFIVPLLKELDSRFALIVANLVLVFVVEMRKRLKK